MLISSIYKSLQRSVVEIMEEIKVATGHQNISYWSWENRADENELGDQSYIGISGFDFNENRGLWVVRFSLGLSPWNDLNMDAQVRMLDVIFEHLGEGKKVNLLEANTGALVSEMVASHFHIAPATTTELRNYRVISFELLRTDSAEL